MKSFICEARKFSIERILPFIEQKKKAWKKEKYFAGFAEIF